MTQLRKAVLTGCLRFTGDYRTTNGQHMHQLAIVTELGVDTDPLL